jgi:hypothetical protein
MKSKIAQKIKEILESISALNYVSVDWVRLTSADFNQSELPAVQLIDVFCQAEHERLRAKKTWGLSLELIMRGSENEEVGQKDLWDLEQQIHRELFKRPNFDLPGVISLRLLSSSSDLHLLHPYYYSRSDFEVIFYENLTGEC